MPKDCSEPVGIGLGACVTLLLVVAGIWATSALSFADGLPFFIIAGIVLIGTISCCTLNATHCCADNACGKWWCCRQVLYDEIPDAII